MRAHQCRLKLRSRQGQLIAAAQLALEAKLALICSWSPAGGHGRPDFHALLGSKGGHGEGTSGSPGSPSGSGTTNTLIVSRWGPLRYCRQGHVGGFCRVLWKIGQDSVHICFCNKCISAMV